MKLLLVFSLVCSTFIASATAYDFSWSPGPGSPPASDAWLSYFNNLEGGKVDVQADIRECSQSEPNIWAATFDDGPTEYTNVVLDYFRAAEMKTTFWVIGANVIKSPDILQKAFQEGHQIGVHTWSHPDLTTLSEAQVVSELVYGAKAIYDVTGKIPKFFRPPYGAMSDSVRNVAAKMGLRAVIWTEDSNDWRYAGTSEMSQVPASFQSWMDAGKSNEISLEHDFKAETVSVMAQCMDIVRKAGKKLVTISECIGDTGDAYQNPRLLAFFESGQFAAPTSTQNYDPSASWPQNTAYHPASELQSETPYMRVR
ncbi:chitin deacetylase [Chytriomyces hyalinus]|nr:chitin deacetylase [Chytriomyces hyalinus]